MVWDGAYNQVYDRWWRPLNWAVADDCFKAEFTLTVQPNPTGSGVGAYVLALTAGALDPVFYDGSQNFAPTDQDGLMVDIACDGTTDNDMDTWYLRMVESDGEYRHFQESPACVYLDATISTYYGVFERLSATEVELHVYTDAGHTVLHGASNFVIHSSVVGLNTLQAGVSTGGWGTRQFNGTLDDITICHCENTIGITEVALPGPVLELQAIEPGLLSLRSQDQGPVRVRVLDVQGREVMAFQLKARAETRIVPLTAGVMS